MQRIETHRVSCKSDCFLYIVRSFLMAPLYDRPVFNATVRHMKKALGILKDLEGGENFADALRRRRGVSNADALSFLKLLLADKLGYRALSANPPGFAGDLPALAAEFQLWRADLVAVFHDPPFLGILNPKDAGQLAALGKPFPRELLVVYAGGFDVSPELAATAAQTALALLEGGHPDIAPELRDPVPGVLPDFSLGPAPEPWDSGAEQAPVAKPRRQTLYSVRVANELFHYGNVEAWKRVIGDYERAHPGCKVQVYYDGEPVRDMNALFTWGKAPWGSIIRFAVFAPAPGDPVRDLAKLRRSLAQASGRDFEALLGEAGDG
jgi:hypothetical protein